MAPNSRIQQIDRQILDLLSERMELSENAEEVETEEEDDTDGGVSSDLEWWIEEGAERGIDDTTVEKFYKALTGVGGN